MRDWIIEVVVVLFHIKVHNHLVNTKVYRPTDRHQGSFTHYSMQYKDIYIWIDTYKILLTFVREDIYLFCIFRGPKQNEDKLSITSTSNIFLMVLILIGVYESKRSFHANFAVNHLSSLREKSSGNGNKMCRVVLLCSFFFTPRCDFSLVSRPPYYRRCGLKHKVGQPERLFD